MKKMTIALMSKRIFNLKGFKRRNEEIQGKKYNKKEVLKKRILNHATSKIRRRRMNEDIN